MAPEQRRERIEDLLRRRFAPTSLRIDDDTHRHAGHAGAASGGGHFRVHIVADAFAGKSRLARHRLVFEALDAMMGGDIHALAVTALAPDESAPGG